MKFLRSSIFLLKKNTNNSNIVIKKTHYLFNQINTSSTYTGTATANAMQDEYGQLDSTGTIYTTYDFKLESGEYLVEAKACYNTYGQLNENKDNVIVVCHALTGNSRLDLWWGNLLGPGLAFDTSKYFIVCANVLGSCYGSTGPRSFNPLTGLPYGKTFPQVTIRDSVRLHLKLVREQICATQIKSVIGGSMGGMQALEWVLLANNDANTNSTLKSATISNYIQSAVIIGCGAAHTAWQIAISETQRQAIYTDPKWNNGDIDFNDGPSAGLSVARQIAMISYRTAKIYESKFGRTIEPTTGQYEVQNYLQYQGRKFLDRFDALTYVRLTQQMDSHDIGRGRDGITTALRQLFPTNSNTTTFNGDGCKVLVMGIDSDILYPIHEQQALATMISNSTMKVIKTLHGHDGFLLEPDQVSEGIKELLASID